MYKLLLIITIFNISLFSQVEHFGRAENSIKDRVFVDILNFAGDDPNFSRVDVFVQVPYNEIKFLRVGDGFASSYAITVSVFDENKNKLITEKMWNEKVETNEFNQTISKNNFNLSLRSFSLQPGKYFFRTSVEDKESQNNFILENQIIVNDFLQAVSLSDIILIARRSVSDEGSNKILPNVSKNVTSQKEGIPIFLEVYLQSDQSLTLKYFIIDKNNKVLFENSENYDFEMGKNQVFYTYENVELSLGNYILNVSAVNSGGQTVASASKKIESRWMGIPSSINDLDKAIDQMIYIANDSEIKKIKAGQTVEEKMNLFFDFWKRKDPTPQTEENEFFNEYYRRVDFANKSFSHYTEGWKTDRGMVYIILGAPNNVDRHPFEFNSKPYEIWEYYELNKQFVFVDATGFGDYRLTTPLYGDYYRYR